MSCYFSSYEDNNKFFIKKYDAQTAFKVLKQHIEEIYIIPEFTKFSQLMKYLGWETKYDGDENIVSIKSYERRLTQDWDWFRTIAPYVKEGSYIECHGKENEVWRWVFDGDNCKEIYPTISWGG